MLPKKRVVPWSFYKLLKYVQDRYSGGVNNLMNSRHQHSAALLLRLVSTGLSPCGILQVLQAADHVLLLLLLLLLLPGTILSRS
jgi:hypothetical protein